MATPTTQIKLRPVVRFCEFPLGTIGDPSMRQALAPEPWENQEKVIAYLKSGLILAYPMGADLLDWLDRFQRANPVIDGRCLGGATPMTDGEWFWYAGLIHFLERYNVRVSAEFVQHAACHGWRVDRDAIPHCAYDFSYFSKT